MKVKYRNQTPYLLKEYTELLLMTEITKKELLIMKPFSYYSSVQLQWLSTNTFHLNYPNKNRTGVHYSTSYQSLSRLTSGHCDLFRHLILLFSRACSSSYLMQEAQGIPSTPPPLPKQLHPFWFLTKAFTSHGTNSAWEALSPEKDLVSCLTILSGYI